MECDDLVSPAALKMILYDDVAQEKREVDTGGNSQVHGCMSVAEVDLLDEANYYNFVIQLNFEVLAVKEKDEVRQ